MDCRASRLKLLNLQSDEVLTTNRFENRLIFPGPTDVDLAAPIESRRRLGGMLNTTIGKPPKVTSRAWRFPRQSPPCAQSRPAK